MNQVDPGNYYEILEISPEASLSDIQRAYQRARETYSKENPALYSMFSPDEARELLKLVEEAYAVLTNQVRRKSYDQALGVMPMDSAPDSVPHSVPHSGPHSAPKAPSSEGHAMTQQRAEESAPESGAALEANDFVVRRKSASPLAPGMGKTSLGTYKLDSAFEAEISSTTQFDGPFLQRVRLYKNISVDSISESTRISRPFIMAVENDDYKSLPAPVFVRGFVVQIARLLGLDENKTATSYMQFLKARSGK